MHISSCKVVYIFLLRLISKLYPTHIPENHTYEKMLDKARGEKKVRDGM